MPPASFLLLFIPELAGVAYNRLELILRSALRPGAFARRQRKRK